MSGPLCRRRWRFSGAVQGVGFRYRACAAARLLDLTGWVRNEWDGTVLLEAQGSADALDRLVPAILRGSQWICIERTQVTDLPLREQEYGFSARD